jgi:hypothetical protein
MRRLQFTGILVLSYFVPCTAAETWRPKISVDVIARDESLRSQLLSFATRELRSIKDIVITDSEPEIVLSFQATVLTVGAGEKRTGYAFHFEVLQKLSAKSMADLQQQCSINQSIVEAVSALFSVRYKSISTGADIDDMRKQVVELIAMMDADILEPLRKYKSPGK